jgi:radical SAM superfamily enzyme YgiQ (UPF0313 family)
VSSIVLATLNAKFIHAAVGLRYLAANMGELADRTHLLEFTIHQRPVDIVEQLLARRPTIVGLGVYIWNAEASAAVVDLIKRVAPAVVVVLGGPEVSYEYEAQPIFARADYLIRGEGDLAFAELCARVLAGKRPLVKVIEGGTPPLAELALPYARYDDQDIAQRVLYVEASRGCPYRCEFCLSSLDKRVRTFDLDALFTAFDALLARGARRFKFVDRTFNLDLPRSAAILDFFWSRYCEGLFLHFEMVPDRLPDELRGRLARFPAGAVQLEVGIQSLDPAVGRRISRRQEIGRTFENLQFLREQTGVHVHVDLIIGLPGEDAASFGAGLDRLVASGVQEIQLGVLKRLRGTPIGRHEQAHGLVFSGAPPYEILQTGVIPFVEMQRLKRFAQVWSAFLNRGDFPRAAARLCDGGAFERVLEFSLWLFEQLGRVHSISLVNRARLLHRYLIEVVGLAAVEASGLLIADYEALGRAAPAPFESDAGVRRRARSARLPDMSTLPDRQRRHLEGSR